jgi:predicted alpha/beta-hydrolase family hydrolase
MAVSSIELKFTATAQDREVSAILDGAESCSSLLVLGHGSGSNMRVPLISGISGALVGMGVATFRYQFPYSEHADFVPYSGIETDGPEVLQATVRSAVAAASKAATGLPLFAGGHSMSGFVTSMAHSESRLGSLTGLVLLGFPLKGDLARAAHLVDLACPSLFIQGTEDTLGDIDQMSEVARAIGPDATLRTIDSAGHGFGVPGKPDVEVYLDVARRIADWIKPLI